MSGPRKQMARAWDAAEDAKLADAVQRYDPEKIKWTELSTSFANRNGEQCRARWHTLDPCIKRGPYTTEEDAAITELKQVVPPLRWKQISEKLPGWTAQSFRSANGVKCRWFNMQRQKAAKKPRINPPERVRCAGICNGYLTASRQGRGYRTCERSPCIKAVAKAREELNYQPVITSRTCTGSLCIVKQNGERKMGRKCADDAFRCQQCAKADDKTTSRTCTGSLCKLKPIAERTTGITCADGNVRCQQCTKADDQTTSRTCTGILCIVKQNGERKTGTKCADGAFRCKTCAVEEGFIKTCAFHCCAEMAASVHSTMCSRHTRFTDWRRAEFARRLDMRLWNLQVPGPAPEAELHVLAKLAFDTCCDLQLMHVHHAQLGIEPSWTLFARTEPYAGFEGQL